MPAWVLALGLAALTAGKPDTPADALTLRDGKVVLGQAIEPAPRGTFLFVVRRAWVEAHLPDLAKRWEADERIMARRAEALRRVRLEAWKRDRGGVAEPSDRIVSWIDRELARLDPAHRTASPLMLVNLPLGQVQKLERKPRPAGRQLRLGWLLGLKGVEEMSLAKLSDALEDRGFAPGSTAPAMVDRLLPIPVESDERWLARRAATEAAYDTDLRFIRIQQLVLPEPVPGQPLDAKTALSALPELTKLLTGDAVDPLPARLRDVAARGRVGAVVTRQATSPDLENVTVEMVLWVHGPGDRWSPFGSRSVTVGAADLKDNDGKDLAEDPQVQMAFRFIESLGLGQVPADVRQKGLNIGAATRQALAQTRSLFQEDLAKLALSIEDGPSAPAGPKGGP
ncbi:MAG: hypothetical protein P4L84_10435 [Isosphaeraceae bacterium]|nr:hypothetical protein [Isosphaeraceae bacterium]